ncbi:MAG: glycoside hydrolase family 16 protein [Marmoricola sp.]
MFVGSAAQAAFPFYGGAICAGTPLVASTAKTCTFDDEFNGTRLNTLLWTPTTTASTGYRVGPECYVNNSSTISVSGGSLHLTTNQLAQPAACKLPDGTSYQTSYTSGMVSTLNNFSQTGGHYEVRARFPNITVPGTHSAIWLYPAKQWYGIGSSGEIDMVERYSVWPGSGVSSLVYPNALSTNKAISHYCTFSNPGDYHVYSLDWTASSMTFSYDSTPCWTTTWSPLAPLLGLAPFDKPFFVCLTEAMGTSFNSLDPSAQLPLTMDVDYVRVWK